MLVQNNQSTTQPSPTTQPQNNPTPEPQTNPTPPTPQPQTTPQTTPSDGLQNFFIGSTLYVNPNSAVAQFLAAHPNDPNASLLKKIADQPTGIWLNYDKDQVLQQNQVNIYKQVIGILKDAGSKFCYLLLLYGIPNRDNGGQSKGGAPDDKSYYAWCGAIDAAIMNSGNPKTVLILEPDAMGFALKEDTAGKYKRFEYLKIANDILTQSPNRSVYLDIAMWNKDTQPMADAIKASLIKNIRGFALNTSGYDALSDATTFGQSLGSKTGLHYIIDTGRNGNGSNGQWENPTGRALGLKPGTVVSVVGSFLDAYVWAKPVGESDGADNGAPGAGQFFYDRAVEMAKNAKW